MRVFVVVIVLLVRVFCIYHNILIPLTKFIGSRLMHISVRLLSIRVVVDALFLVLKQSAFGTTAKNENQQ